MGLQHYELQLLQALGKIAPDDWCFTQKRVGGLRQHPRPDRRLPLSLLSLAPYVVTRATGRWAYRGEVRVHRFDLRLPPAPNEVVTVHDLPPLRFSDEGSLASWSRRSAREARLIICPSEFAANEVRELLDVRRVVVVPNGVGAPYVGARTLSAAERAAEGLSRPYVLHVGGATHRKNLAGLAAAWRELAEAWPDHVLVSVGPASEARAAAFFGLPRVVLTGYRNQGQVARMMASAEAVVVPSTYEGFGLPCLEAMAVGTPVVAVRAGALPEVCGAAALMAEPDGPAIAAALRQVMHDDSLRASLVSAGRSRSASFTWERSAAGHLDAYAEAFS